MIIFIEDILNVRLQTLGVTEHSFDISLSGTHVNWLLYDVGGAVSAILSKRPLSYQFDYLLESFERLSELTSRYNLIYLYSAVRQVLSIRERSHATIES